MRNDHEGTSAKKSAVKRRSYIDITQGGRKAKGRRALPPLLSDAKPPEDHQEMLKKYLQFPESRYDYFGDLIEFERPGLTEIHRFVKATALGRKPDNNFLLTLALALAQFLKPSSFKVQQAGFARHLRIVRKQGRKTPAQGQPIEEVQVAKLVMDLQDGPDGKVKRKDAIEQVCRLLYRDKDLTKYRTVERWHDAHKKWVTFVYAWRDELRNERPSTRIGQEFLKRAEDYVARVDKGVNRLRGRLKQ